MSELEWVVLVSGIAAVGLVNWYFFVAGRGERATAAVLAPTRPTLGAVPEIVITVDGGYAPSTVRVTAGEPIRLIFERKDNSSCSEEVVFPDFSIRKYLPTGAQTGVEITPPSPGRYEFMCGMSMLRGVVIAEEGKRS